MPIIPSSFWTILARNDVSSAALSIVCMKTANVAISGSSSKLTVNTTNYYFTCKLLTSVLWCWWLGDRQGNSPGQILQGGHSPVLVKFPDFSRYFLQRHQRYTDRPTCTPEWLLWHYWQSILCMSTYLTVPVFRLCLFCDHRNCASKEQAQTDRPQFP